MENALLQIVAIAVASLAAQWVGWRLKMPAIVFLLLAGFVLGPLTGVIVPHQLMGDFLRPAVNAAVAIILFEGSLNLKLREIHTVRAAVRHMVLIGAPLGWALIAAAAYYIGGLSLPVAVVFGGMLVVTGPTVIIPMLRHARLNARVSSILKWEGIINDPIGVIFAIVAYEYFRYTGAHEGHAGGFYLQYSLILALIVALSHLLGRLVARVLERGYMPEYLKAPFLMSVVLALYAACDLVLHESGLIAIVAFGMTLANVHVASIEEIRRFKETVTLLLVSGVFILLTANLDPQLLLHIDLRGAAFIAVVLFIIRPLIVAVSSVGTGMTWQEIAFVGWIAPRGVVCAAMAGIMQPLLAEAGYQDADRILPLAFAIVVLTVVLHSFTVKPWARRLDLKNEQSGGLIIVGATDWTSQLAEALHKSGLPVMLTDTDWGRLKAARLSNVPVYYGEMLSEEAEYNMEMSRYGALLAATPNAAYNALLCNAYAPVLGRERVYQISAGQENDADRKKVAATLRGRTFMEAERTYGDWWRSFMQGWRFHLTTPRPADSPPEEVAAAQEIIAGIIDKNGVLICKTSDFMPPVKEGDKILVYSPREAA